MSAFYRSKIFQDVEHLEKSLDQQTQIHLVGEQTTTGAAIHLVGEYTTTGAANHLVL